MLSVAGCIWVSNKSVIFPWRVIELFNVFCFSLLLFFAIVV